MRRKIIYFILLFLLSAGIFSSQCWAVTLLTEKEALSNVFHEGEDVRSEIVMLSDKQIESIHKELGNKFLDCDKGMGDKDLLHRKEYTFYFASKNKDPRGTAIILEEPGKWGPIGYMVRLNPAGAIEDIYVMSYSETRGRPVARRSFLQQFIGKTLQDQLTLGKDIVAISGATFSSKATVCVVKKAMAVYKECYLKK